MARHHFCKSTSPKRGAALSDLATRLPSFACDAIHVGNFVVLTRSGIALEPGEIPAVLNLLPYRDPREKPLKIVTPDPRTVESLFDKKNAPWCFLCLKPLGFKDVTKAHILPRVFREPYKFARYKAHRKTLTAPVFSVVSPVEDMFVYLCEGCRRREKKFDDVWTNVLKTAFPFSHGKIRHPDGAYISRDKLGLKMNLPSYDSLSNPNVHLVVASPQPMLIMLAKLKASYFLKVFTTLVLRGAAPDRMRVGLRNWPARQMIMEWMEKPKVDPQLISYQVSRQPFSEFPKSLNWIQRSAAARIPRGATTRTLIPSGPLIRLAQAQLVISLIPTFYVGHGQSS